MSKWMPEPEDFWKSDNSQLENPHLQKVARIQNTLGELEHSGTLCNGVGAILHFQLAQAYLAMVEDPKLESIQRSSFMYTYMAYSEGINHYRATKADPRDPTKEVAQRKFLETKDKIVASNMMEEAFKNYISETGIKTANIEGIENG